MNQALDQLPANADVVIIGGGVIGNVIAYTLSKAGHRVVLVEQNAIGSGTTSAAAAAALLQTKTSEKKLRIANTSIQLLDQLHAEMDHSFEFNHTGSLLAAMNNAELDLVRQMNANLKRLGLDVQMLDPKACHEIYPILSPNVIAGSYSPLDAQINPLEYVSQCAKYAKKAGALYFPHTSVIGFKTDHDHVTEVQTDRGTISASFVVNATGVWSKQLSQLVGAHVDVEPLKGELLITERLPLITRGTLISAKYLLSKSRTEESDQANAPKRSVGITLVQVSHGNFVVGSTRELSGYDKRSTYDGIKELVHQLLEITPGLKNYHLLRAYSGLRPVTPDGSPIIGAFEQLPNLIHATGFGGDGLAMSPITARIVQSCIEGSPMTEYLELFSPQRFTEKVVA